MTTEGPHSLGAPLSPQALAGAVASLEGMRGSVALVHGSTGCKFYLSSLVEQMDPREGLRSPNAQSVLQLFGQRRVPCTDVWDDDLVFGGEGKLAEALLALDRSAVAPELIGVVTTTPLSVIADDVAGLARALRLRARVVCVDGGGLLGPSWAGFDSASVALVREVMLPDVPRRPGTVNLLGVCILQPRWRDDVAELRRMIRALGLEVGAVLTAGASVEEVRRAPAAEANVVVHPEYGAGVAEEMRSRFGQPCTGAEGRAPYGLGGSIEWVRSVGRALGVAAPRLETAIAAEVAALRERVSGPLSDLDRARPLKGRTVAVFGETSPSVALAAFLTGFLGLEVVILGLKGARDLPGPPLGRLSADVGGEPVVLLDPDLAAVRSALREARPDLVVGSTIEQMVAQSIGLPACRCVDFGYPLWHRVTCTRRPFVGFEGTLTLLEDVLNAAATLG